MDLGKIRVLIVDVDGTLTDGRVWLSPESGDTGRFFNVRDATGIKELQTYGVKVVLMTKSRADDIKAISGKGYGHFAFDHIYDYSDIDDAKPKLYHLNEYCRDNNISLGDVAIIGDDEPDLMMMHVSGHSFCPQDAHNKLKGQAGITVLEAKGGRGCVRELCDMIVEVKHAELIYNESVYSGSSDVEPDDECLSCGS